MNRKCTHPVEVYLRNIHKETNETVATCVKVIQIKIVEPEFIHWTLYPFLKSVSQSLFAAESTQALV